uniref:Uncharacterized protein n=1 Tax=Dunaliella tertiolecta TaxID=3047 RepID=A0A6S8Q6W5_DUNTE
MLSRMVGWPLLFLSLLLSLALLSAAGGKSLFKVGIVSSVTGELTDWHESVEGWEVYKSKLDKEYPLGFPIIGNDATYRFSFELNIRDDESNLQKHEAAVADLISEGVDFIANAQPNFAMEEALQSNKANLINIHGVTSNTAVFERALPNVFGLAQPMERFFPEPMKAFKDANVDKVAIVYRGDLTELRVACKAAVQAAEAKGLSVQEISYTSSDPEVLYGVTRQVNLSSSTLGLVGCTLSAEAHQFLNKIHEMRKPLKGIMFTNGPANHTWLEEVGELALNVLTPASWHKDTDDVTDFLMVDSAEYSRLSYSTWGRPPTHIAAGASACGYVLQKALEAAFTTCNIGATEGNASALLFGDRDGKPLIDCQDGKNFGKQRVIDALTDTYMDTFFGKIVFSPIRQNFGGHMVILQVKKKTADLQPYLGPSIALPRGKAIQDFVMPMPNRYPEICKPGSFINEFDPGRYAPCLICQPGDFMDQVDGTYCDSCLMNQWVNTTGNAFCHPCPENTETLAVGADDIRKCQCIRGFYAPARVTGTACLPCPEHATCAGGIDPPRNLPGWYAEADNPHFMYDCNPEAQCTGNYTCATGYEGRLCQSCADGYFRAFDNCIECISPAGNIIAMLCMYCLFIYLVVGVSRNLETIHLLMNFCQTLSIVAYFNMQWPLILENIFSIAGILSFEMDIIQPQCATKEWGFAENLYIQLSYPAFLFLLQGGWCGAIYLAFRAKMRMNGKSISDFPSMNFSGSVSGSVQRGSVSGKLSGKFGDSNLGSIGGSGNYAVLEASGWWLFLQTLLYIPSTPQEMHELILENMSIAFMSLNLGYVVILKYCLQAFSCFDFEGTKYMYFNADELCYTPEHFQIMTAAAAGLIVYIAGTWFMFITVMRVLKQTNSFCKKRPLLLFGWMYERYESKCYWFELTILAEKTILVVVAVFIPADPILQVIIMLIVSLASTLLSIKTSAPVDSTSSLLLTATDGGTMVIMVLGLMFYNSSILDRTYTVATVIGSVGLIGLLVVLAAAFFVEVAFHITILVLRARHKNMASKWGQDTRLHVHMFRAFKPWFIFKWLTKADPDDWLQWHKLCKLLQYSVHPTCETSYLSQEKVGHFWSYLISSFPEMLDFLASVEEEDRNDFLNVIEVMYEHYFDTANTYKVQLNSIITERFRAAIGQWLSSASNSEVMFIKKVITKAFAKAQGEEAEAEITRAFSRSSKSMANMCRRASSEDEDLEEKKLHRMTSDGGSLLGGLSGASSLVRGTSGPSPQSCLQGDVAFVRSSGGGAQTRIKWGENLTEKPKKSFSIHSPRVNFSNSGKPQTASPFAAVQEPDVGIGHGSMPLSNSDILVARNITTPRDNATDTDELLRVQSMHSPRPDDQPLPQPPCLKVHTPTDALPSVPADVEAGINQNLQISEGGSPLGEGKLSVLPSAPADIEAGINKNLRAPEGASPLGEGRLFDKRPSPFGQDEAGTLGLATSGQDQPTEPKASEGESPVPSDDIVRPFI